MVAHVRWWSDPRRKLRYLLKEIRAGHLAIESLKEVRGGMKALAADVAQLLHEQRALERRLVEKDIEADQRVATKADAMQRVIGSLRLQAIRDPLTGLFNRRALDELLPRLIDHSLTKGEDLALMMIDVDFFKQLNDQLGHAAGDEMLRSIGQLIRSGLGRQQDVAFRCGGDEFVVVLPGAPAEVAKKLGEQLTSLVGNLAKTLRCNPRPGLSVGIATISALPSPTAALLLQEADKRLYEVKQKTHRAARAA
jgi:diguanylate cyclase (GGDEF)-like protein